MGRKSFSLCISFMLIAYGTRAQQTVMSLDDCLVYARDHAFTNRTNRLGNAIAKTDKRIQAADMLPYIGFGTNANLSFGRGVDPETNTYDTKQTFSNGYSLSMELPLFDGLVSLNNYRASRMAELRQQKATEAEADQISLAVIKAYYNIMYYSALVQQMESLLANDKQNLAMTERQEQLGSKSGADVAAVKAMVAGDEYELLNQQNLKNKAIIELKAQMGMPMNEEICLNEECRMLDEYMDSTLQYSSNIHPRIAQAEYALRQSRYQLRAAYGNFMPKLSANGGISTSYYKVLGSDYDAAAFSTQWHNNMGQYVGVTLSLPLFDGLANINRLKRAKLSYRQQQVELDKTRYEIERETTEALLDLNSAHSEYKAAQAQVAAEEIAQQAVQRKYELGGASTLDLYTSNSKLATARATLTGKKIQTVINRIIYEYYIGERNLTPEK